MPEMDPIDTSASALSAQRRRMDVIAQNIANAETTRTPEGGPYRRQQVVFTLDEQGGVEVSEVVQDPRPPRLVYQPGHPDADAAGYVALPNVNLVEEMVDMISAMRSYEANVTAINAAKAIEQAALDLGSG
jgi:flagellar basal-body rod protein FlgC